MSSTKREVGRTDERGAVTALVAALLAAGVLFGIAALVVDLGFARDQKQASQVASDASALAAANALYPTGACASSLDTGRPCMRSAIAAAKAYALKNYGVSDWSTCASTPPPGSVIYDTTVKCITFDNLSTPRKVWARMPAQTIGFLFAGNSSNSQSVDVDTRARANLGTVVTCGLCFLGDVNTINADFTVNAGSIAVNGSISSGPNSYWTALSIAVAGTINGASPTAASNNFSPKPTTSPIFGDPYAYLALPTRGSLANKSAVTSCSSAIDPGVYGNLTLGNNDDCTLNPGLYIVTGRWLLGNHSSLNGTGVTIYFTCGTTTTLRLCNASDAVGSGGYLDGKNGDVNVGAGAPGFSAFAIIYDRANPNNLFLQGNGGAGTGITGAVYAVNATLDFNGNSTFNFTNGPVVAKSATGNGQQSGVTILNSQDATVSVSPPVLDQ